MINKKSRPGRPRLTQPLIREESGFREATWEEALGRISTAL